VGFCMAAPWKHPKTGIWWYRRATPRDLMKAGEALTALGFKLTREIKQSLDTRNRREAQERWSEVNAGCEKRWRNSFFA